MLQEFLSTNRGAILGGKGPERILPGLYDRLLRVLDAQSSRGRRAAAEDGPRPGISEAVDGFALIHQSIADAARLAGEPLGPGERAALELALDLAIAQTITEAAGSGAGEA